MTPAASTARLRTALTLVLAPWLVASSAAADAPWLGLADLRQPADASRVYPLDAGAATPTRLHYLPLAPPAPARIACCLRPGRGTVADDDALRPLELTAHGDRLLDARTLARPPRSTGGNMIALALAGPVPQVQAVSAQRLRLTWPGQAGAWRVERCASSEGMHLRLQPEDGSAPPRAFYLPLGMDVEADCPAHMLVPPPAREK